MNLTLVNNRYNVIRSLGRGGFGETFLVEDSQLPSGRHCVLKQLIPLEDNPQVYELVKDRFQREAAILEDLGEGHQQIPRLYAYFAENHKFYLVQEYVEGETLLQNLERQGIWSEAAVRQLLVGILPVLSYVHSRRIIHRDIKPDNIMLRSRDQAPVLIDFGAVRETMGTVVNESGKSTQSIVIGTPGFMASEQAGGRPTFGSDLYSLGLTAIYLLTGRLPQDLPSDPLSGEVCWRQFAPMVSPSFGAVLTRAVMPGAQQRFQTAQEMLDALLNGEERSVNPSPIPTVISVPAPVSQMQTIAVAPVMNNPVAVAPPVSSVPEKSGMSDWAKMLAMFSLVGGFVLAGLAIMRSPEKVASNPSPPVAAPTVNISSPVTTQASPSSSPQEAPQATSSSTVVVQTPAKPSESSSTSNSSVTRPDPAQFIRNHYAKLNQRNYSETWQSLSPGFQRKSQGWGSYTDWWDQVARTEVGSTEVVKQDSKNAVVNADLTYVMKKGRISNEPSQIYLGWNDDRQSWEFVDKT